MDREEVFIKDDGQLNFMGTNITGSSQERKHEVMDDFVNGGREKVEESANENE